MAGLTRRCSRPAAHNAAVCYVLLLAARGLSDWALGMGMGSWRVM
jgi:hypothetical protein